MKMASSTNNTGDLISEPGRVELIICSPHQPVRLISAKLTGQIKSLQRLWPNSQRKFIFNGSELTPEMTFDYYGIKSGDSIIALPVDRQDNYTTTSRWITQINDPSPYSTRSVKIKRFTFNENRKKTKIIYEIMRSFS